MKKLLLLVAAATLAFGQVAATPQLVLQGKQNQEASKEQKDLGGKKFTVADFCKISAEANHALRAKQSVTPEGTAKPYLYADIDNYDMAVSVSTSDDGTKVFFSNMFPNMFASGDAWVQGNVATDGASVTIPMDVAIGELTTNENETYPVYVAEILVSGWDITGVTEAVFVKDGDSYRFEDDADAPTRYLGLCVLDEDGTFVGYFDVTQLASYTPYEGNTELVELPEGAEPAEFIYRFDYGYPVAKLGKVYVDGNDVYMNMLACGYEAWVKGTREGNTVTFKGDQYIGAYDYYLYFTPLITGEGNYDEMIPGDYVLTYDPETGAYTSYDDDEHDYYASIFASTGDLYDAALSFVIEPYVGDAPAVPSDPYGLEISDLYLEEYGQYLFMYWIDNVDVDGNFINPAKLGYYLYLDGEIYTCSPEVFTRLEEEMTLIPYGYADNWDFFEGYCMIGETLFSTLGVQAVYTVDGVSNYSNVVSVDLEGNVTTEPAPQGIDGLNNVEAKQVTAIELYDAEGRRLQRPQQGVNIVRMMTADGDSKNIKFYKK